MKVRVVKSTLPQVDQARVVATYNMSSGGSLLLSDTGLKLIRNL